MSIPPAVTAFVYGVPPIAAEAVADFQGVVHFPPHVAPLPPALPFPFP
jgi:hypothetical protein